MSHRSRTNPRYRILSFVLGGACVLAFASLVAFGVAGADTPTGQGKRNNALENPNFPFPTDAHLRPEVADGVHRQATARATAATGIARNPQLVNRNPPPTVPPNPISPWEETAISPAPLFEDYGPLYKNDAMVENYFHTFEFPRKGDLFVIVAGSSLGDPQAGFVGVAAAANNGVKSLNKSLTPTKHGSVHITEVKNGLVYLQAKDGTKFTFNHTTYAFV